ncbi:MAG: hypothetical protein O2902_03460, partial [Actinobacteria bacterium]|nr:hypothetical protein [Actinomycetota bacterium]
CSTLISAGAAILVATPVGASATISTGAAALTFGVLTSWWAGLGSTATAALGSATGLGVSLTLRLRLVNLLTLAI